MHELIKFVEPTIGLLYSLNLLDNEELFSRIESSWYNRDEILKTGCDQIMGALNYLLYLSPSNKAGVSEIGDSNMTFKVTIQGLDSFGAPTRDEHTMIVLYDFSADSWVKLDSSLGVRGLTIERIDIRIFNRLLKEKRYEALTGMKIHFNSVSFRARVETMSHCISNIKDRFNMLVEKTWNGLNSGTMIKESAAFLAPPGKETTYLKSLGEL